MSDNRTLSITIVATSEKAQAELRRLGDEAQSLGLKTGAASEKVGHATAKNAEYGEKTRHAFDAVQSAATSVGASLGPVGEVLENFASSLEHVEGSAGRMQRSLKVAAGAMTALGGIITIEAARDQASLAQLEVSVTNTGKKWEDYGHHLENAAASQAKYGHSNKDALDALTKMTTAFNDPEKAIEHLGLASDISARQHISLADAAGLVSKVVGGSFRPLQQYGINIRDLADPVKTLTAAQHDLAAATEQLSGAQQRLTEFEARLQQQEEQGAAEHAARVQEAQQKVADAEQHLADVQQRITEETASRQQAAQEAVTSTTDKLAAAREHLADVERELHERTQLTLQDQFSMRDAQESLVDVQQRIADGQLSGADAAQALREAQERVSDTAAVQAEKQKVTIQDQENLAKAQKAVTDAAKAQADAVAKARTAGRETTAEHNARRDAVAGVTDAHAGLAKAQASSSGQETLAQLQQEQHLREAVAAAAEKQKAAQEKVAAAKKLEAEFSSKVEHALDLWEGKVKGSAEAQSRTLEGMFKHWVASAQNAFAKLGPSIGLGLVAASAALDLFMAASKAKWFTHGAAVVAINAETDATLVAETGASGLAMLGEWLVSMGGMIASSIAAGAAMVIAFAPLILAVAAIGIAAYELYKHWDTVWGFIKGIVKSGVHFIKEHIDWVIAIAFGPFGIAVNLIRTHWDSIWGAIKKGAGAIKGFFVDAFHGLADVVLAPWRLIVSAINTAIDMIDSIHFSFHAPSWAGGFGWDFKGFGIPTIPPIPRFADGGIVPGRDGEPQLVLAHGGERISNKGQQAARWGGAAGSAPQIHMHFPNVVQLDRRAADQLARQIGKSMLEEFHRMQNQGTNLRLVSR